MSDTIHDVVIIEAITSYAEVEPAEVRTLPFSGLFAHAPLEVSTTILQALGLDMEHGGLGSTIKTDAMKETSVPGVFACGNSALPMASIALAVGGGNHAGVGAQCSLMFGTIHLG